MTLHVVGCVAQRFGPSFEAVYRQPYDETLRAFLAHLDLERLDGLKRQREQAEAVLMHRQTNDAFLRVLNQIERRLDAGPRAPDAPDETGAMLERIAAFPGMPGYKPVAGKGKQNKRLPVTLSRTVS